MMECSSPAIEQAYHALTCESPTYGRPYNPAETMARIAYLDGLDAKLGPIAVSDLLAGRMAATFGTLFPEVEDWTEIADLIMDEDWIDAVCDEIQEKATADLRAEVTHTPPTVRELRQWLFAVEDQDAPVDVDRVVAYLTAPESVRRHVYLPGEAHPSDTE